MARKPAGLAYPVADPLKGRGKMAGFGRTSKADKSEKRALTDITRERREAPKVEQADGPPR